MLLCLCGTPLLLWPAAVALTAQPAFRRLHMPAPRAAQPAATRAGDGKEAAAGGVPEHDADAAAGHAPAAASKKEE